MDIRWCFCSLSAGGSSWCVVISVWRYSSCQRSWTSCVVFSSGRDMSIRWKTFVEWSWSGWFCAGFAVQPTTMFALYSVLMAEATETSLLWPSSWLKLGCALVCIMLPCQAALGNLMVPPLFQSAQFRLFSALWQLKQWMHQFILLNHVSVFWQCNFLGRFFSCTLLHSCNLSQNQQGNNINHVCVGLLRSFFCLRHLQ